MFDGKKFQFFVKIFRLHSVLFITRFNRFNPMFLDE